MYTNPFSLINLGFAPIGKIGSEMTEYLNWETFNNIFYHNLGLALNRYDIEGLPESMNKNVMKQSLLWYGSVVFFSPDKTNNYFLALPGLPSGDFTLYREPMNAFVYSYNGQINEKVDLLIPYSDKYPELKLSYNGKETTKEPNGCIIWENYSRYPFIHFVYMYSKAMADSLRTIDIARRYLKVPLIAIVDESQVPTVRKYLQSLDRNEDVIVGVDRLRSDDMHFEPISTAAEGAKTAIEMFSWYESQFLTLCGYNANKNIDKKGENLIRAEINVNDELEDANLDKTIECLTYYMEPCNNFMGTNIRFVTDYKNEVKDGETDTDVPGVDGEMESLYRDNP